MSVPTDELLTRIGRRVRQARRDRGLTAREAAERSGLSVRFFSQLESGQANIAIGRLAAVAAALDAPLTGLVDDTGEARGQCARPIALLGLRGAGKSTLGPRVAAALGLSFVQLDERIEEAAGLSLTEIFTVHGEEYYRRLARECLERVLDAGAVVLELPGGIVRDARTFALVRKRCTTAWLRASPTDHVERVLAQGDPRPVAGRPNAMAELRAILAEREPLYRQADLMVDTSRHDERASLRVLLSGLERAGWASPQAGGDESVQGVRRDVRRRTGAVDAAQDRGRRS